MNDEPKLGPTNDFPQGQMGPQDEGGIRISIAINEYGRIIVDFAKPVAWIGLDAISALDIAMALVNHACQVIKAPPRMQPMPHPPQTPSSQGPSSASEDGQFEGSKPN